ncbi:MAG: hypothetical protein JWO91_3826 [Acidobacteriaceae bacterium]|jgi:TonB family protein|nr:hypothetical protein [Acidobacteriaceae bacterium]
MMQGEVSIEFAIFKTGKVKGMRLAESAGDVSLDRAAWGASSDTLVEKRKRPRAKGRSI